MTEALQIARLNATGQIVAQLAKQYSESQVLALIISVRKALEQDIAEPAEPDAPALVPAVPIKKSVTPDFIICLEDGKKFKSLKRHLRQKYGMTPEDYRAKWGLSDKYPMTAPNYSAKRSQLAKDNGLGTKK